jgi:uncharacterized protein (TIGR03435 family)
MRAMPILTLLAACGPAFGQPPESALEFEAASVKPAGPFVAGTGARVMGGPGTADPGRINFSRATLADLLRRAYDVYPDQVSGPAWINDRGPESVYTVVATIPPGTTTKQFQSMLQKLIAERFHVTLHREMQARPGYELVVSKGGPKLKEWDPAAKQAPFNLEAVANSLPPGSTRISGKRTMADLCRGLGASINEANGTYTFGGPVPRVVDKTGLTGIYDFTLEYSGSTSPDAATDPGGGPPNLFIALERQLGLKLQKVKDVPVEVLIVDRADRIPAAN